MFGKLFGKKDEARREEDKVWLSAAARMAGLQNDVASLLEGTGSVVIVAHERKALDALAAAFADRHPAVSTDAFSKEALQTALRDRHTFALALASTLQPGPRVDADHDVQILVCGRNLKREPDDAICRFADPHGSRVHVTFHLALDDPLMAQFGQGLRTILDKLNSPPDEAIQSRMVTRAIANAQAKNK